jgi:hypothetical protein
MLSKIEAWLSGKKTYICAVAMLGAVVFDFISKGDYSIPTIVAFVKSASLAGAIAALRSAFTKQPAQS